MPVFLVPFACRTAASLELGFSLFTLSNSTGAGNDKLLQPVSTAIKSMRERHPSVLA